MRSESRVSQLAHCVSWEKALHVIHNRHPEVAAQLVTALEDEPESRFLCVAGKVRRDVEGVPPVGKRPPHTTDTKTWHTPHKQEMS